MRQRRRNGPLLSLPLSRVLSPMLSPLTGGAWVAALALASVSGIRPGVTAPPYNPPTIDAFIENTIVRASDREATDLFGGSVAISGDTAVIGARSEDGGPGSPLPDSGAAYIFERDHGGAGNWGEIRKLVAADAQAGNGFGVSVAISGDTAIVGADSEDGGPGDPLFGAGAAYVFGRDQGGANNWGQIARLAASDAQAGDSFGGSVAISADTAIVGAHSENGGPGDSRLGAGAAYVFERHQGGANGWGEISKLTASDAQADDHLGSSVAIFDDAAIAGAPGEDIGPGGPLLEAGAAYLFQRRPGGASAWVETAKLIASDTQTDDSFGIAVAISSDTAIGGAELEDGGPGEPLPGGFPCVPVGTGACKASRCIARRILATITAVRREWQAPVVSVNGALRLQSDLCPPPRIDNLSPTSAQEHLLTTSSAPDNPARHSSWLRLTLPYQKPDTLRSLWQVINSVIGYGVLWYLMYRSLVVSYWLTLALSVLAAGLLIRTFIIFHDCGHGSFFRSKKANDIVGFITGIVTFTPYDKWRREHAMHHATAGDLDRRGVGGDVWTMTVEEYLASPWRTRWAYRIYRNPAVMLLLGPSFLFLVRNRFTSRSARRREQINVYVTNVAIAVAVTALMATIGVKEYLMIQAPITLLGGAIAVWMFYVQHQFEEAYWEHHDDWEYVPAAIEGSSFYQLPRVLHWYTGNIGYHHIHHLSPRIPNYFLRRCHEKNPELATTAAITIRTSLRSLRFRLWDEKGHRMVGFRCVRTL